MSKCVFCGKEIQYGNDIRPIRTANNECRCCDDCNERIVIPTRRSVWSLENKLNQQLAEKDKNQNQKAIQVLEELSRYFRDYDNYMTHTTYEVLYQIKKKVNELKGKMEDVKNS